MPRSQQKPVLCPNVLILYRVPAIAAVLTPLEDMPSGLRSQCGFSVAGETGDGFPRPLPLMIWGSLWPTPSNFELLPMPRVPVRIPLAVSTLLSSCACSTHVGGRSLASSPPAEQLAGPPSLPAEWPPVLQPCFPLALSPSPEMYLGSAGPTDVPPPPKPRPLMVGGGAHATQPGQVGRPALREQTGGLTHRLIPVCPSSAAAGPPPA